MMPISCSGDVINTHNLYLEVRIPAASVGEEAAVEMKLSTVWECR